MAGIGAGQLILLAATPFLARAFGPAAFGHFSVIVTIAGVLATVAALRLDLAVASAADEEVGTIAWTALALPVLVIPVTVAVMFAVLSAPVKLGLPFGPVDLPAVAGIALLQGLVLVQTGIGVRMGAFRALAAVRIAQALIFAALALSLIPDLEIAMALGWAAALVAGWPIVRRLPAFAGLAESRVALSRNRRFVLISTPVALLDIGALALPLLFIAAAYGPVEAGNFSQVQRLLGAPLMLVATASAQIFFRYAGEQYRAGRSIRPLYWRVAGGMTALALLAFIAIAAVGHPVMSLLMGPSWRTDVTFLLLAVGPVFFRVIASPVSSALIITGRLGTIGVWQSCYFVVTFAVLWFAHRELPFEGLLLAYAFSELVMYGVYLLLSARAAAAAIEFKPPANHEGQACAGS